MSLYEVIQKASGQRVAVATRDILPGTLLFTDELIVVAHDFPSVDSTGLNVHSDKAKQIFVSFVGEVMKLPQNKRERYFNIYAHQRFFELAQCMVGETTDQAQYDHVFFDIVSIFLANAVIIESKSGQAPITGVYEKWTLVDHSCGGNCVRTFSGETGTTVSYCRAGRPIRAGEYLTISAKSDLLLLPTHVRRAKLLHGRCFTCHCPRCDAKEDDTRQFDCFDSTCQGRHLVCQPISSDTVQIPRVLCFEGVVYVEPHLLPCTVCRRSPPPEYQQQMFQLEQHLHMELERIKAVLSQSVSAAGLVQLYKDVKTLSIPAHHALVYHACALRSTIIDVFSSVCNNARWPHAFQTSLHEDVNAAEVTESILHCATLKVRDMWCQAAEQGLSNLYAAPELAKYVVQKYLQVHYIMFGREDRIVETERDFREVLNWLPTPQEVVDMAVCTFCEESPQRAALTLSKCARCRKVAYCSKGCQKAHWPLHKQQCTR